MDQASASFMVQLSISPRRCPGMQTGPRCLESSIKCTGVPLSAILLVDTDMVHNVMIYMKSTSEAFVITSVSHSEVLT
jgi:hypothetical protein